MLVINLCSQVVFYLQSIYYAIIGYHTIPPPYLSLALFMSLYFPVSSSVRIPLSVSYFSSLSLTTSVMPRFLCLRSCLYANLALAFLCSSFTSFFLSLSFYLRFSFPSLPFSLIPLYYLLFSLALPPFISRHLCFLSLSLHPRLPLPLSLLLCLLLSVSLSAFSPFQPSHLISLHSLYFCLFPVLHFFFISICFFLIVPVSPY